ncbi:hypothetical protein H1235_08040 [Pseudoxanthomonas sp. NC8]|nr:hypothetical protein H1235_08040 [Pseudoxanthomonas sp. NC8]
MLYDHWASIALLVEFNAHRDHPDSTINLLEAHINHDWQSNRPTGTPRQNLLDLARRPLNVRIEQLVFLKVGNDSLDKYGSATIADPIRSYRGRSRCVRVCRNDIKDWFAGFPR